MTRMEVIMKAIEKRITWLQAADIIGICPRHMRRIKKRFEKYGVDVLRDHRAGRPRRKRISIETVGEVCRLKENVYPDFSMQHFYEYVREQHKINISYTWMRAVLETAGIVEKAPGRGKYRRQRERRPMTGMLLHIDGSRHAWLAGLPPRDLIVMMDDADGRILHGRFVEEEGTMSTFEALHEVLTSHGRFCELYHDRGSHFGRTSKAGEDPDEVQNGQVPRALKALGIRQIYARTPQARGRSERCFGTIQGRLPQELRLEGITSYEDANRYLAKRFIPKFNRLFAVAPAQAESAFVPLVGIDLTLLLSIQHERVARNDNTVPFNRVILQIPKTNQRPHYARCPVLVHEFPNDTLGISYQAQLLARYTREGDAIRQQKKQKQKTA